MKELGNLGNMIALSDVSGSMSGPPMEVSIAMGILVSELAVPAFRDRFITFETNPKWHKLPTGGSLKEKVVSAQGAAWGGTTNFGAALQLVLDACVKHNIPSEQVKGLTLAVFSDMQFDMADGNSGYYRSSTHEPVQDEVPEDCCRLQAMAGYITTGILVIYHRAPDSVLEPAWRHTGLPVLG